MSEEAKFLSVKLISNRSRFDRFVEQCKNASAVLGLGALIMGFLPSDVFLQVVSVVKPIFANANPAENDIAPSAVNVETSETFGWTYVGKSNDIGTWNYNIVGGGGLAEGVLLNPKWPVYIRNAPMTAANPGPEIIGVVKSPLCFSLVSYIQNERTNSLWAEGSTVSCP